MKIYFSGNLSLHPAWRRRLEEIIKILNQAGVLVVSNLKQESVSEIFKQDLQISEQTGEVLLEKVDAVIIEGTHPTFENGHLIALALTHQKPILYLLEKGFTIDQSLRRLQHERKIGRLLKLEYYTNQTLSAKILDFLQLIERGSDIETPTIKFTLRITPRIERYLSRRAKKAKLTKADFLRQTIEKLMNNDEVLEKDVNKSNE